jgi:uncharacterized protein with HEPN domain
MDNVDAIEVFTTGMDVAVFAADRKTVYAVVHAPEIVSEASRRLPPETKSQHPELDRRSPPLATSTGTNTMPWMRN